MRRIKLAGGLAVLALAAWYLAGVAGPDAAATLTAIGEVLAALAADPAGLAVALACYLAAFGLRAWGWRATLPGLGFGQSWAALHVSLLGNHVLPLRLGEALRVTSVLRRTSLPARPVLASAVTLRGADLVAVVALALLAVPGLVPRLIGGWGPALPALLAGAGLLALAGAAWTVRLARRGTAVRLPSPLVLTSVMAAWALESAVVFQIASAAGHPLSAAEAVAVTAVTIVAQAVAVTPGGLGSYEAAATAALVAVGVPAVAAFAIALTTHAVKTGYALVAGAIALVAPGPGYWGRWRVPRALPPRPGAVAVPEGAPVVAFLPVHNEESTVGAVVTGLREQLAGRNLVVLVVDDGSTDSSAARALEAGAVVIRQPGNLGLGAAVRRGLAEAAAYRPRAVLYLDADGEYAPADAPAMLAPVLSGAADYVVGSRFTGRIGRMLPHRRFGNRLLTRWMRWLTRRRDLTDGQSGYRAFSPAAAAAAEIVHDYNYAQVLTLDLLAKGFRYAEVPITYSFRDTGKSFVTLGRYLWRVVPAVHRELNAPS
ncbi:MAG TPA: glycosyltransferase [Pseudonocardiaceae bacterium]|nr:glycosyltransferase [Pseudonocardiaceae bacterium]